MQSVESHLILMLLNQFLFHFTPLLLLLSEASIIVILQSGGGNSYGAYSGYSSSRSGGTG